MERNPFSDPDFANNFLQRRLAWDSVNLTLDEPAIFELAGDVSGATVLDIGTAFGHLAMAFAERGARVDAIDSASGMLGAAIAMNNHPNIRYVELDATTYLGIDSYDFVVSGLLMQYVEDLIQFAYDVYSVLNDGGAFIFSQRHPLRTSNPGGCIDGEEFGWIVKDFFVEGERSLSWCGKDIRLFHRSTQTIIDSVSNSGLRLSRLLEPSPNTSLQLSDRIRENKSSPAIIAFRFDK